MDEQETGFDEMIGARLRERRIVLQMSQTEMADHLGVSFQQVQKYERGINRVSAETLVRACGALGISPAKLFDSIPMMEQAPDDFLKTPDEVDILRALRRIESPRLRSAIVRLVTLIADGKYGGA